MLIGGTVFLVVFGPVLLLRPDVNLWVPALYVVIGIGAILAGLIEWRINKGKAKR